MNTHVDVYPIHVFLWSDGFFAEFVQFERFLVKFALPSISIGFGRELSDFVLRAMQGSLIIVEQ